MTREELKLHCLKQIEECEMWARYKGEEPHGKVYEEHKLILKLLEQQPCEDTINRQAAIDALELKKDKNAKGDIGGFYNKIIQNDIDTLMQLPSVRPEKCTERRTETYSCDCISRQTIKDQMIKYGFRSPDMTVTEFIEDLRPSNSQESCEDCISRQAAIRIASGYCHPANIAAELSKLPSAQPERKKGLMGGDRIQATMVFERIENE